MWIFFVFVLASRYSVCLISLLRALVEYIYYFSDIIMMDTAHGIKKNIFKVWVWGIKLLDIKYLFILPSVIKNGQTSQIWLWISRKVRYTLVREDFVNVFLQFIICITREGAIVPHPLVQKYQWIYFLRSGRKNAQVSLKVVQNLLAAPPSL